MKNSKYITDSAGLLMFLQHANVLCTHCFVVVMINNSDHDPWMLELFVKLSEEDDHCAFFDCTREFQSRRGEIICHMID